ncbi:MAG: hypothetical protein Q8Q08_05500 [Candidatus Omnitrophota bacterium]|nr:hypothetical protein [Candidatus Omnitrophota bacterium]MDZ4242515.1 hypothetical protein [Candidatus Omnitrophota bacterium]
MPALFLTMILTVATVAAVQLSWWVPKNGIVFFGTCVNHFGEPYECTVIDWIDRGLLSPFAWPAVLLIALIWFLVCRILLRVVASRKSARQRVGAC